MTNQELLEKRDKAQKVLEVWLNNISNPMIIEIATITIEALENYIESIDNQLKSE